ncbi:MAG: hypothetical protein SGILL_007137 [Bacillariaceae sp.]
MASSQSTSCPFQAKNTLWYPSYRDKVAANIKHNQAILEKLGLGDKKQKNVKKTKSPKRKPQSAAPATPTRLSKRIRKEGPELAATETSLQALDDLEEPATRKKKIRRYTNPKTYVSLNEAELAKLKIHWDREQQRAKTSRSRKDKDTDTDFDQQWMEEMNDWMLNVPHGTGDVKKVVSKPNARTVMRQVQKLVVDSAQHGKGVAYHHWHSSVTFCWWKPVPADPEDDNDDDSSTKENNASSKKPSQHIFTCNLQEIYNLAQEMEDMHGKDLGNGWLLLHPIRKLQLFQEYYYRSRAAKIV